MHNTFRGQAIRLDETLYAYTGLLSFITKHLYLLQTQEKPQD